MHLGCMIEMKIEWIHKGLSVFLINFTIEVGSKFDEKVNDLSIILTG